jgi:hypothetical protein
MAHGKTALAPVTDHEKDKTAMAESSADAANATRARNSTLELYLEGNLLAHYRY